MLHEDLDKRSCVNKHGYVIVRYPEHPQAHYNGYVYKHRAVMERLLGRYLERHEVVHHKDGNRANNCPENLELQTCAEHSRQHKKIYPDRTCVQCGENFTYRMRDSKYCSRTC